MANVFEKLTEATRSFERSEIGQRIGRAGRSIQQNSMVRQLALAPRSIGRRLLTAFIIAVGASLVALAVSKVPTLSKSIELVDTALYDSFFKQRKPESRYNGDVVMISVDDSSLDRARKLNIKMNWPWSREYWATLTTWLEQAGAKVIVFDIFFEDARDPEGDIELAKALDECKVPVVLGEQVPVNGRAPFALDVKKPPTFGAVNIDDVGLRVYQPAIRDLRTLAIQAVSKTPGAVVPEWANKPFRIHFYGPTKQDGKFTFHQFPALDVVSTSQDVRVPGITPDLFHDKIIVIGATANGAGDVKTSPVSPLFPGPEMQATAISNLLENRRVLAFEQTTTFGVSLLASLFAAAGAVVPRKAWAKLLVTICVIAGVFAVGFLLFTQFWHIYWLPLGAPLFACAVATLGGLAWTYLIEDRQRRVLKRFLAQYVSPDVAAKLDEIGTVSIGGVRRELSLLFSDIAGFTTLSEQMESDQLEKFMNFYLSEMSAIVFAFNGTLDKYIGDAVMSFWNAPLDQPDHAVLACRTALGMHLREEQIRPQLAEMGAGEVYTRIGVNTGFVKVGNYGSMQKLNYTAIGDSVNLASRLEGANKIYGSQILVAQTTVDLVGDRFLFRRLDSLKVKGKDVPMAVYELMAEGAGTADQQKLAREFGSAFAAYKQRNWDEAERILIVLGELFPDDGPLESLLKRVRAYRVNPPPADWDGAYIAKDK